MERWLWFQSKRIRIYIEFLIPSPHTYSHCYPVYMFSHYVGNGIFVHCFNTARDAIECKSHMCTTDTRKLHKLSRRMEGCIWSKLWLVLHVRHIIIFCLILCKGCLLWFDVSVSPLFCTPGSIIPLPAVKLMETNMKIWDLMRMKHVAFVGVDFSLHCLHRRRCHLLKTLIHQKVLEFSLHRYRRRCHLPIILLHRKFGSVHFLRTILRWSWRIFILLQKIVQSTKMKHILMTLFPIKLLIQMVWILQKLSIEALPLRICLCLPLLSLG